MSREAKVGIFVVLGLVVLTYFTFRVSKWGGIGERGYSLSVDFESASGLEPKADVKMAGVPVGKVEEIQLVGNRARLFLRIDDGIRVPVDSVASIQTQGLLGERYVELFPGKETEKMLPEGGRIANTLPPTNLDEIVRKVNLIADDIKKFTDTLAGTIGTQEGKESLNEILRNVREASAVLRNVTTANEERMNSILANIDTLSADLKEISSANKENLRATIANLREFSQTLKERTPDLARKLEAMGEQVAGAVGENRENIKESIANFRSASAKLDNTLSAAEKVLAKVERGEGTLGKLISDNTTVTSINDTLEGINRYVRKSESLKFTFMPKVEYLARSSDYKYYVDLRIQPSADKYYLVGLVKDPLGKFSSTTLTTTTSPGTTVTTQQDAVDDKWKFTAQLAKRFSGVTVRGGVIESVGGLGLEYDVLKERFTLGGEVFDFNRKGQPPHLKAFGNYDIVKNLFITGGVDDILNNEKNLRTFFFGFGIRFVDDDLKTVLGAVPIKP